MDAIMGHTINRVYGMKIPPAAMPPRPPQITIIVVTMPRVGFMHIDNDIYTHVKQCGWWTWRQVNYKQLVSWTQSGLGRATAQAPRSPLQMGMEDVIDAYVSQKCDKRCPPYIRDTLEDLVDDNITEAWTRIAGATWYKLEKSSKKLHANKQKEKQNE